MKRVLMTLAAGLAFVAAPLAVSTAQTPSAEEIIAQFNFEPTAAETIQVALQYAGLNRERLESMYARAAGSKALPKQVYYEFTGRWQDTNRPQKVVTYSDEDLEVVKDAKATDYVQDQDYTQHKVRATWELSGLVFNKEQLDVYKAMTSNTAARDKIVKQVSDRYFARRKLMIELNMNPNADVMARLNTEIDIQQLNAELDAYTGGWFTKQLKKK